MISNSHYLLSPAINPLFPLVRKKQNMRLIARRNRQAVNEKNLFHGTTPDSVEAICKQNFDWRLHGKNASKYGEGSYFAVNASYSHSYAKRDGNMSQFIFLTKVLVGSYTQGHSSYRRPPPKQQSDPASDLYDSCVDNKSNPTIFVVFDTDQFYPEYIIQYSCAQPKAPTKNTIAKPQPKPVSAHTSLNSLRTVSKPRLLAGNSSSYLAPSVSAKPKAPTRNTAAGPQPKRASSHTSLNSLSIASKPSLPAGNSSSNLAPAVSAKPKAPTQNTATRTQPKRASSHTSLNSLNTASKPNLPAGKSSSKLAPAVFAQLRTPTRNTAERTQPKRTSSYTSLNSLNTVSKPSRPAGYLAPAVSRSGSASTNATTLSSRVGAALNANGSTVSQATSLQQPTTTMSASLTSQTYPRGNLKQQPTSFSGLGSTSRSSGSPVSDNKRTVFQTKPGTNLVSRPTTAQTNHQGIPKKLPITSCNVHETGASSSSSTIRSRTNTNNVDEASSSSRLSGDLKKKKDCMIM